MTIARVERGGVLLRLIKTCDSVTAMHVPHPGYHLSSLRLINPSTIVVSVGRKPETDASRKYCAQCPRVFSTRYYGNLRLLIDDSGTMRWLAERNAK